jgi:hypothetical protein
VPFVILTFVYRRCELKRLTNFSYLFIPTRICLGDADRIIFHISTNGDMSFFAVALRPNASHGLHILEVSRSHTMTHHSRQGFSGRVISSSQRQRRYITLHNYEQLSLDFLSATKFDMDDSIANTVNGL